MIGMRGWVLALACAAVSGCATTTTKVTTNSDTYRAMARSQQWWCSQFGCDCTLDGMKATCTLVAACVNQGSCQAAK